MKIIWYLLMLNLICNTILNGAETLTLPLEISDIQGCHLNNGVISLHSQLPSQQNSDNIVIEAENPTDIFFQADVFARKGGAKAGELIQIKQSAENYKPQFDDDDASGGYIDYTKLANYQFHAVKSGVYETYFRIKVPSIANWGFDFTVDDKSQFINLAPQIKAANKWFWAKGPELTLSNGSHHVRIANLLNGKRLDQIAFIPKGKAITEKMLTPSTMEKINIGTINFKPLAPAGLICWDKITFNNSGSPDDVNIFISTDDGKNYLPIKDFNLKQFQNSAIRIQAKLKYNPKNSVKLSDFKIFYLCDPNAFFTVENKNTRLIFNRKNGTISQIINLTTSNSYKYPEAEANLFELLLKSPNKNNRRYISQKNAKLISIKENAGKSAQIEWSFPDESINVILEIVAQENQIDLKLTVNNQNEQYDVIEVEGPKLSEIRVSQKPEDDCLIWPFSAGEFIFNPARHGEQSVAYPDHAGLPFMNIGNDKEGLYFGCHDLKLLTTFINYRANYAQNAVEMTFNRKHRIPYGSSLSCNFAVSAINGDWHKGAELYQKFFYENYPINSYRPWLRNTEGWLQGTAAGHTGLMKNYNSYSEFIRDFKTAAFNSLTYIQMWGSTFNGACPSFYLPRKEKGGEDLFAQMMLLWRKSGGQIGHYYFANGISPYYILTEKYFNTPWSEYDSDLRPPSYDWYLKNMEYSINTTPPDKEKLLAQTRNINKIHQENKIIRGNNEEITTGYMPMNWRTGAYPDFLKKWISRYVNKYNCNTAYLDTFAFRNDLADFNPYLKLNGEGDKPEFKKKFMDNLITEMRKTEPDFCALTEGVSDIFGTKLYFLLSGFARNPNIYRYTLPDQIFFQGSSNGLWTRPLTEKSILQSFLLGNRYDFVVMFDSTYYMIKLKQLANPFFNLSRFNDKIGVKCNVPEVEIYSHIINKNTNSMIPNHGTGAILLAIGNPENKTGNITYKIPDDFNLKYAIKCELYNEPVQLKFQRNSNNEISFNIPNANASWIILVDELKGPHQYGAILEQPEKELAELKLFNYLDVKQNFQIKCQDKTFNVVLDKFEGKSIPLQRDNKEKEFEILQVKIDNGSFSEMRIISIGESGRKIPQIQPPTADITSENPLNMNFEALRYSDMAAYTGKRSLRLAGNQKFQMIKIPLKLEPETTYLIEFAIKKGKNVSKNPEHNCILVGNYTKDKELCRYGFFAGNIAPDGQFHRFKAEFTTDEKVYAPALFLYNINSSDDVFLDDLIITKYSSNRKKTTPIPVIASTKPVTNSSQILNLDFESAQYHTEKALEGKGALTLSGEPKNGSMIKIPLQLEPNCRYQLRFAIRKDFNVSTTNHDNMGGVINYDKNRKIKHYLLLGSSIQRDDKWHWCAGEFETDSELDNCGLYFYNKNSHGPLYIDAVSLEKLK